MATDRSVAQDIVVLSRFDCIAFIMLCSRLLWNEAVGKLASDELGRRRIAVAAPCSPFIQPNIGWCAENTFWMWSGLPSPLVVVVKCTVATLDFKTAAVETEWHDHKLAVGQFATIILRRFQFKSTKVLW